MDLPDLTVDLRPAFAQVHPDRLILLPETSKQNATQTHTVGLFLAPECPTKATKGAVAETWWTWMETNAATVAASLSAQPSQSSPHPAVIRDACVVATSSTRPPVCLSVCLCVAASSTRPPALPSVGLPCIQHLSICSPVRPSIRPSVCLGIAT
jgi:hypothetical protein